MEIYYSAAIMIPAITFFYMFFLWKKYGKDENVKNIAAQTEPPKGISPAMADYIFDNKFTYQRYLLSTIIEMAVNGFIVLETYGKTDKIADFSTKEKDPNKNKIYKSVIDFLRVFLNDKHKQFVKDHSKKMENVALYETKNIGKYAVISIFVILFSSLFAITVFVVLHKESFVFEFDFGEIFFQISVLIIIFSFIILFVAIIPFYILRAITRKNTSDRNGWIDNVKNEIKEESYKEGEKNIFSLNPHLKEIREKIIEDVNVFYTKDSFKNQGIYPFLKNYSDFGVAAFVVLFLIFLGFLEDSERNPFVSFIYNNPGITLSIISAFFLPAFIIFFFDKVMAKRNVQGTEIYRQILGFKKYLSLEEKLIPTEATQELFEKHLSYAIALGARKEWANRFSEARISLPSWFIIKDEHGNISSLNVNGSVKIENKIYSAISSTFIINKTSSK